MFRKITKFFEDRRRAREARKREEAMVRMAAFVGRVKKLQPNCEVILLAENEEDAVAMTRVLASASKAGLI